jgi:hypothetical protein
MPTRRDTILHLPGKGSVEAALLSEFLGAFSQAHNAYLTLERRVERSHRDYSYPRRDWLFESGPGYVDELVSASERVVVVSVELASPGHWDLLGIGKALDVLRQYLVDRDERKRGKKYVNREEERRLILENDERGLQNDLLRLEGIERIVRIGRDNGIPEQEVQLLARRLLEPPLERLGAMQDRGVIDASRAEERPALPPGEQQ